MFKDCIWVCEECNAVFTNEEWINCQSSFEWGHICKAKKYKKEHRCESYCQEFSPIKDKTL